MDDMRQNDRSDSEGNRMSRPTEEQLKGILWTRYPQYFNVDKKRMRVTLTDDAPPEIVESFMMQY